MTGRHQKAMRAVLADLRRYARKTSRTPFEIIANYQNAMVADSSRKFQSQAEFWQLSGEEETQVIQEFIAWY